MNNSHRYQIILEKVVISLKSNIQYTFNAHKYNKDYFQICTF